MSHPALDSDYQVGLGEPAKALRRQLRDQLGNAVDAVNKGLDTYKS